MYTLVETVNTALTCLASFGSMVRLYDLNKQYIKSPQEMTASILVLGVNLIYNLS